MNYVELNKQHDELAGWLAATEWTVFGTLKFTDGHSISEHKAEAIVRKFFNSLDRAYLGRNLVDAGHRIERVVFKQVGSSGSNLHYHFVAQPCANAEQFCEAAKCKWDKASSFTMGYEHTIIERARSAANTSGYGLHEFWKIGSDTLCLQATYMSQCHPKIKPIQKLRCLLKMQAQNECIKESALLRVAIAERRKKIAAQTATY
ncbi:hypothetical protein SAMN05216227_103615 [Pseudorhodobacter antarcticus]|uniref:Bacteriophage replication gene A protein (GPA) n=1 Tax=Pseudorhodobacter antarcticus TaxID=1077947 RepID=A0A1H8KYK7_9RHOB|nr:hypothetical protein [Pseudorhodobacter antarcticus]SEN97498.1 hypothetical protein SAMN05216227_103615 [Pseudorhodobacter antarcticus]